MQKLDFTSVLDSFGIPITLLVKPEKKEPMFMESGFKLLMNHGKREN